MLGMERLILFCDGIDTLADIELNGIQVLHCDNMHRKWEADCPETIFPELLMTMSFTLEPSAKVSPFP